MSIRLLPAAFWAHPAHCPALLGAVGKPPLYRRVLGGGHAVYHRLTLGPVTDPTERAHADAALLHHHARWQGHDLVFCKPDGRPLNGTAVTHAFQSVLVAAGLPALRFHDLRHTHVALLINLGVQPRLIMDRLGHSTIATTMDIYGHIFPAAGREAADRLDQMFASTAQVKG